MREVIGYAVLGKFTLDGIAGVARAVSEGTAALNHESGDDSMEGKAVIEAGIGKLDKVCNGVGRAVRIEFHDDGRFCVLDPDGRYGVRVFFEVRAVFPDERNRLCGRIFRLRKGIIAGYCDNAGKEDKNHVKRRPVAFVGRMLFAHCAVTSSVGAAVGSAASSPYLISS